MAVSPVKWRHPANKQAYYQANSCPSTWETDSQKFLIIAKYWIGIATSSVTIMPDVLHTLSDSLTSVIVLVETKLSAKDPDEEHLFGHGRIHFEPAEKQSL